MRGGHQHTCQCFSEFRPLVNVASACYSPLHFGFRRVFFTRFTSAFSSILKMLALIVATEIQLFLNENHVRFPTRVNEADIHIAKRHLAIILTEFYIQICPIWRSLRQTFDYVTHQLKWRDLRTLIEKVFRFFLLMNH